MSPHLSSETSPLSLQSEQLSCVPGEGLCVRVCVGSGGGGAGGCRAQGFPTEHILPAILICEANSAFRELSPSHPTGASKQRCLALVGPVQPAAVWCVMWRKDPIHSFILHSFTHSFIQQQYEPTTYSGVSPSPSYKVRSRKRMECVGTDTGHAPSVGAPKAHSAPELRNH